MRITETLKQTLSSQGKFLTLSLVLTLFERCVKLLAEYGISKETLSFVVTGYERISEELIEGYKYIKEKEEFNNIVKDNHLGDGI